ncbi:dienelactone hydrolase family protein [Gemmatimonas sp.]|uniref:dienelactone hydrolase family protein n=1 Tax=Gemmatimonas sp. TaxID=1962908 RepID=UPI00286A000E|nr:dienelactone hydrolase family protein [Gemmatimonas sp.]
MFHRSFVIAAALPVAAILAGCTLQRSSSNPTADDHMAHMNAADRAAPVAGAAAGQGIAGLPASNSTAPARLKASPRHAEWVKIAWDAGSADSLMAWVVYPASPNARAKAPVVVVVHEIFGLSTWVRGVADQVAADGFIAIAPDFLSKVRGGPSSVELSSDSARKLIAGVNAGERNRAIAAAANYAMMLPSAQQKYAVIGYCWGGQTVFMHAVNGGLKGFSGGVAFYGLPYTTGGTPATATTAAVPASINADSLAKIKQPVMLLNGSKDARIAAAMPALDSIMKGLKKNYAGTNYEGATHGFLRAQDDPKAARDVAEEAANLAATKDGWPKTIAFLKKNLGVK